LLRNFVFDLRAIASGGNEVTQTLEFNITCGSEIITLTDSTPIVYALDPGTTIVHQEDVLDKWYTNFITDKDACFIKHF